MGSRCQVRENRAGACVSKGLVPRSLISTGYLQQRYRREVHQFSLTEKVAALLRRLSRLPLPLITPLKRINRVRSAPYRTDVLPDLDKYGSDVVLVETPP